MTETTNAIPTTVADSIAQHIEVKPKKRNVAQETLNADFTALEQVLDLELKFELLKLGLTLEDTSITHFNPQTKLNKIKSRRISRTNGFTLFIIHTDDGSSYVSPAYCNVTDNFNRLIGRCVAKEKAADLLKDTGTLDGFIKFDLLDKANQHHTNEDHLITSYFRNIYINKIKNYKEPVVPVEVPFDEAGKIAEITAGIKASIVASTGKDVDVLGHQFVHIRNHEDGLVTYSYLREAGTLGLDEKGGLTVFTLKIKLPDARGHLIIGSTSLCSPADNFSKAEGRKYAIKNFMKDVIVVQFVAPLDATEYEIYKESISQLSFILRRPILTTVEADVDE